MQYYQNCTNDYARRGSARNCRNAGNRMSPAPCPHTDSSGCAPGDPLEGMPLAMAYVPWQSWRNIYSIHKGLSRGTIFEELDKPFQGKGGCSR